ncbi:hypothetical protein HKX48_006118 [Thoreauomyces humboldtii]|nr:hypothetical protein HKX48_006118 [Thoreauomyces humboldtii]
MHHLVSVITAALLASPLALAATACNGDPALCSLRYDQVTYAATHNSGATNLKFDCHALAKSCTAGKFLCWGYEASCNALLPGNFADCLWDNVDVDIITQLNDGIRVFDIDTCAQDDGSVVNCHGFGTTRALGPLVSSTFNAIAAWVKSHPNEVITLTFGDHDGDTTAMGTSIKNSLQASLGAHMYTRNGGAWATLGDMVSSGKTVVAMLSRGLDTAGVHYDWVESYDNLIDDPYFAVLANDDNGGLLQASYLNNWCTRDPKAISKFQVIDATIALNFPDIKAQLEKLQFPQEICNSQLAGEVNYGVLDTIVNFCSPKLGYIFRVRIDYYRQSDLFPVVAKLNARNIAAAASATVRKSKVIKKKTVVQPLHA